jgi:glutamine amidotransferase
MFGMIASAPRSAAFWMLESCPSMLSLAVRDRSGHPNPNGWGIGWYDGNGGTPQVTKEDASADGSLLFEQTARAVRGTVMIAHVRRSSGTPDAMPNTHPFVDDEWLFCHNGYCARKPLWESLSAQAQGSIVGDTDSEVYFTVLMQHLRSSDDPVTALADAVRNVGNAGEHTGLNFLLTDGRCIFACRSSTFPEKHGLYLRHAQDVELVSSEPMDNERWEEIPDGSLAVLTPAGHVLHSLI